jgi:hypothetical protein
MPLDRRKLTKLEYLLIFIITFASCIEISSNLHALKPDAAHSVGKAMADVIREFFIANDIDFDFLIYDHMSPHIDDVIRAVMKELREQVAVGITHIDDIISWTHTYNRSAVILMRTGGVLENLHYWSLSESDNRQKMITKKSRPLKFLVYVEEIENSELILSNMSHYIKRPWMNTVNLQSFEFFLTRDHSSINLTANVLFSEVKSMKYSLKLLNSFDMKSQKWNQKLRNFDHFSNFYDCVLSFALNFDNLAYSQEIRDYLHNPILNEEKLRLAMMNKNFKVEGLMSELLQLMAKRANFTVHIVLDNGNPSNPGNAFTSRNYEITGPRTIYLMTSNIDISSELYHWSDQVGYTCYYYLVTPNDFYTNYEKLVMPFDELTWILLLLTFGLTFGMIFGLHRCPRWIRTIVFGSGINNPAYNALGIFFGISQFRLPRETFSRALLILFAWFCLIFRTCWQSMMFEFMTTDMRKPYPESIEDLRSMNYTIMIQGANLNEFVNINKQLTEGLRK